MEKKLNNYIGGIRMNDNLKIALVLRKLDALKDKYAILSMGFAKDYGDIAEFHSEELGKTVYPVFDGFEDTSVFFLTKEKVLDIKEKLSNNQKLLNLYDDSVKTYSMVKVTEVGDDKYDIQPVRIITDEELLELTYDLDYDEYEYKPLMDIDLVYEKLKESIVGQDDAIKQVLSTVYFNQKLFESDLPDDKLRSLKQNILVIGDTGTGKTEMIKQMAKVLDIPCVIEDATQYTIEGYKGLSVDDMFKHLCMSADYDLERAQRGILVIDEIDKKSSNGDVSQIATSGVQYSLLKLLEGTKYFVPADKEYDLDPFEFDSARLTVILSGSFSSLKEEKDKVIGFEANSNEVQKYNTNELKKSGIVPELLGRMSKIVYLNSLSKDDYIKILNESNLSVLNLTDDFYKSLGINVVYTDSFIDEVARLALTRDSGARGLKTVFDEALGKIEFELLKGNVEQIIFNGVDNIEIVRKEVKEEKKKTHEKVRVRKGEL